MEVGRGQGKDAALARCCGPPACQLPSLSPLPRCLLRCCAATLLPGPAAAHLEELLHLLGVHRHGQAVGAQRRVQDGVLVHVLQQDGGADGGAVVQPRAAVSVAACSAAQGHTGRGQLGHTVGTTTRSAKQIPRDTAILDGFPFWLPACAHGSPNLEVEGAVDAILLGTEDARQVVRHSAGASSLRAVQRAQWRSTRVSNKSVAATFVEKRQHSCQARPTGLSRRGAAPTGGRRRRQQDGGTGTRRPRSLSGAA